MSGIRIKLDAARPRREPREITDISPSVTGRWIMDFSKRKFLPHQHTSLVYTQTRDSSLSNHVKDRWPSWLWRQVKVSLATFPGHESGVGSSPTLFKIIFFLVFSNKLKLFHSRTWDLYLWLPIMETQNCTHQHKSLGSPLCE
jgi:hypothetical protein